MDAIIVWTDGEVVIGFLCLYQYMLPSYTIGLGCSRTLCGSLLLVGTGARPHPAALANHD